VSTYLPNFIHSEQQTRAPIQKHGNYQKKKAAEGFLSVASLTILVCKHVNMSKSRTMSGHVHTHTLSHTQTHTHTHTYHKNTHTHTHTHTYHIHTHPSLPSPPFTVCLMRVGSWGCDQSCA